MSSRQTTTKRSRQLTPLCKTAVICIVCRGVGQRERGRSREEGTGEKIGKLHLGGFRKKWQGRSQSNLIDEVEVGELK
ncbi:hypothetical protein G6O67_004166 [Ophiocordyceps sinensis]|uniref:Uncharacterized protein n=2 Tax=Ophiocordyceps sinensis TaxID=72228 RepID=A0A8H4LYX2_9HYPO|nr:hypothetical protein OCS_00559 [Ophiocordyceps sinensis CO18]KAF4507695.1 hypothetical protein G6O67_004166 [Ophiocordyceps sinensis]